METNGNSTRWLKNQTEHLEKNKFWRKDKPLILLYLPTENILLTTFLVITGSGVRIE